MKAETATIQLPRTILETGADKDIELECNLADYLPGINRVIRTEANVIPEETLINGNKAEVKGKAVFSLLYESDYKGKLKNEKYTADFTQRFDVGDLPKGECFASSSCRCSYVSCKTLNPRRFVLKCRADIHLDIKAMQSAAVVSMEDCKGAFFKSEKHHFNCCAPQIRKDFSLEESFSLEGQEPIADIIYATLRFLPPEMSVSDGSTALRSNGIFKCLYETENGDIKLTERNFSASVTVDDETINEDCECGAEIICGGCEVIKEQDNYGEYRTIVMNCNATACVSLLERIDAEVPTDMYFEEYECAVKGESLGFEQAELLPRHKFGIEKHLEMQELPFAECVDTDGVLYVTESVAEEGGIRIKGKLLLNVLGKGENGFYTQDYSVPFEEELPLCGFGSNCKIKANAMLCGINTELAESGVMKLKAAGELCCTAYKKSALYAITDAEVSKREDGDESRKPVIIYYPDLGETAWEIGKRYHTSPQSVVDNNLDAFDKDGTITKEHTVLFM